MLKHSLYAVALIVVTLGAPAFFPQKASAAVYYRSARVGGYGGYYGGGYRSYGAVGVYNRGFYGSRVGFGGRYYR
jgi:hypothetical protein